MNFINSKDEIPQNLLLNIFDLTMKNEILAYRENKDAFDNQTDDLRYGIDYDFVVKSFYGEFKLDVKELKNIQQQYSLSTDPNEKQQLENRFRELYPECGISNIAKADIPDTVLNKNHFVQSPKREDGLPAIILSVKGDMLADLRATRSAVKKDMTKAALAGDDVSENRYNAKQLAIKVVCNSEYGSSDNEYFAHYDPVVASTVTRTARRLINFLTTNLENDELFVDERFLKQFKPQIDNLKEIKALDIEKLQPEEMIDLIKQRRHCIRRLFDDSFNLMQNNIFRIKIKPSIVCYQDTDSNYYKNEYIADYYTKCDGDFVCDPETIDQCMHSMLAHNELMGGFVKDGINSRPYALGFEGAFIVCRYLNRKKKYYGIKWGDDAELRLTARLPDDQAYDPEEGYLIEDYSPFWIPKKTVIPQPNGDYIYIDTDKLLHKGVNYLDYVHDQDVKCTGVDLARRDQFKFINFFHIVILQKDLRVMKYDGYGNWSTFAKDEPMEHIISNVVETFHRVILQYQAIAELETDKLPEYDFNILDFAKNSAYRVGKQNAVTQIIKRLQREGKPQYIPGIGERMTFVTLLDEATKQYRAEGKAKQTNTSERSYVVQEILDQLHKEIPESEFNKLKEANIDKVRDLSYDNYINAKAICMLDIKWYLEYLCKSIALYIVGDKFPDEIKRIDNGEISPKDAGALITKLQEKISKEYVLKYFPRDRAYAQTIRRQEKQNNLVIQADRSDLVKRYPDVDFDNLSLSQYNQIHGDLSRANDNYSTLLTYYKEVFRSISTDKFFKPKYKNQMKQEIYEKYKSNLPQLEKLINDTFARLANVKACQSALEGVIKIIPDKKRLERLDELDKLEDEAADFM